MAKKYLMGLDLGTDSVGWCVTDEKNHIVRKQGKHLWGVNLFDEASDCKTRRTNRIARRRTNRRKERIALLQSLFKSEMAKTDPNFFLRMNNSFYHKEDKTPELLAEDGTLFAGVRGLTDKDFYKKFPTIYHLRKYLLESNEKADIRCLYLTIHHIIKYRGNFLQPGENWVLGNTDGLKENIARLNETLEESNQIVIDDLDDFVAKMCAAKGVKQKEEILQDRYQIKPQTVCSLLSGRKVKIKAIFGLEDEDAIGDVKEVDFKSASIDDTITKLQSLAADRLETQLICACKAIFDYLSLRALLGNSAYLSDVMVDRYEKHKRDLRDLKKFVKNHYSGEDLKTLYARTFRLSLSGKDEKDQANYVRYVGSTIYGNQKITTSRCPKEDFYKFLKTNVFHGLEDEPEATRIIEEMNQGTFLPRQNDSGNGIFPYQLNLLELKEILSRQKKHHPFLTVTDEYGSIADKIISILTYHIPYYVGPLMEEKEGNLRSSHSWVVFTEKKSGKILPWNFKEAIDEDASAEKFIRRMLNKCSYLDDEDALPKYSLLYSEYEVLEFLTRIKINGKPLTDVAYGEKDITMSDAIEYLKHHKLTVKTLDDLAKEKGGKDADDLVTFKSSSRKITKADLPVGLVAYQDFSRILGESFLQSPKGKETVENIILDLSVFPDREIVYKRLKAKYGMDNNAALAIKSLNYSGFGKLSKAFLEMTSYASNEFGEAIQIRFIDAMRQYGMNHMELINDGRFEFKTILNNYKSKNALFNVDDGLTGVNRFVSSLYMTPQMKRPVIRAYEIIQEVKKIIGAPISEFYVECTRRASKGGDRTKSRYKLLEGMYEEASRLVDDDAYYKKEIKEFKKRLSSYAEKENDLKADKLFLYFLQLGRDIYSLEPIDLEDLNDESALDIDHIVPQSVVKDDSVDNRVLVHQEVNRSKSDQYPVPSYILGSDAKHFWRFLKKIGFMSDRKYDALVREESRPLTDDDIMNFTNRQLTTTNQAVVALIKTINHFEKKEDFEPKVIYSKAGLVSAFRQKFSVIKCREANHFHHAHDAYLNIVVGRAQYVYFGNESGRPEERLAYLREHHFTTNPEKIFENNQERTKPAIRDHAGNVVWNYEESLAEIHRNVYECYDVMVTMTPYIQKGLFNKVSVHPASDDKGDNLIPVKKGLDTKKYGGFSDLTNGFASLLKQTDKNGKATFKVFWVPNMMASFESTPQIERYVFSKFDRSTTEIILPVMRVGTIIRFGKTDVLMFSKTSENMGVRSVSEPFFNRHLLETIKKVTKVDSMCSDIKGFFDDPSSVDEKLKQIRVENNDDSLCVKAKKDGTKYVSDTELLFLYDRLISFLSSDRLEGIPSCKTVAQKLKDKQEVFQSLHRAYRCHVLVQCLNIASANSPLMGDLSLIREATNAGKKRLNTKITGHFQVLAKSITGFYTKVLFEN